MTKKIYIFFTLSICLLFSAIAKPKTPTWMKDVELEYPTAKYVAEKGYGTTQQEAENDAVSRIARYFESNIQTTTSTSQTVVQKNDDFTEQSVFDEKAIISSNVKLFTVKFTDPYFDSKTKTYYSVAFIDRDLSFNILKPQMDKLAKAFSSFYDLAQQEEDTLYKCKLLKQSQESEAEFLAQYAFLQLLNSKKAVIYSDIANKLSTINSEIAVLLPECTMTVIVENDLSNTVLAATKTAFAKLGYPIKSEGGKYLVTIIIGLDEQEMTKGTFYYPDINISVTSDDKIIANLGKIGDRVGASKPEVAKKRAYQQIQKIITEELIPDFNNQIGN